MTNILTLYRRGPEVYRNFGPRTALADILTQFPGNAAWDLITEGRLTGEMPAHCSQCREVSYTLPMTRKFLCPCCGDHSLTSLDLLTN